VILYLFSPYAVGLCDSSNMKGTKPMVAEDFEKVEQDLQKQLLMGRFHKQHFTGADDALFTQSLGRCSSSAFIVLPCVQWRFCAVISLLLAQVWGSMS
jgi:hypothetical protein